jgi:hypothetical protein
MVGVSGSEILSGFFAAVLAPEHIGIEDNIRELVGGRSLRPALVSTRSASCLKQIPSPT